MSACLAGLALGLALSLGTTLHCLGRGLGRGLALWPCFDHRLGHVQVISISLGVNCLDCYCRSYVVTLLVDLQAAPLSGIADVA